MKSVASIMISLADAYSLEAETFSEISLRSLQL